MVVHEVIEAPGKVVLHASGTGNSMTGSTYANEWMKVYTLENDASGTPKIIKLKDFNDSHFMVTFFPAELERIKKMESS